MSRWLRRNMAGFIILAVTMLALAVYNLTDAALKDRVEEEMSKLYPMTARIVAICEEDDTITVKASGGYFYKLDGIEDYQLNDYVTCIVSRNGTVMYPDDDKIIKYHYAGVVK